MRLARLPARLAAFTYVELMMVLGILVVLLMLVSITIVPAINRVDTATLIQVLASDLFGQQQKSMQGELSSTDETTPFGIYFEPSAYVLFQGSSYQANHPDNFRVQLPAQVTFSAINVPNQTIVFARMTGEVSNYNSSQNTVTLSPVNGGMARVLQINRYGVVELY